MNNSSNLSSRDRDNKKDMSSQQQKSQLVDFQLTYDQYFMLQYHLPKKYALLQLKLSTSRRGGSSAMKNLGIQDQRNISRMSGNIENTSQLDARSKRSRIKKIDRYLDQQPIKQQPKRSATQKIQLDDQMMQCLSIVNSLKKHRSAGPFLYPVDPKHDGAYNYSQIIKQPMDLSTIEKNLKAGQYQTSGQFHGDICKIWHNSYAYNQKTSPIYKMTIEMEKYYKNLLANDNILNKTTAKPQKSKVKQRKQNQRLPKASNQDRKKRKSESKLTVNVQDAMKDENEQEKEEKLKGMDLEDLDQNYQDKDYEGYD